jgi:signal transduction histidine kinase
MQVKEATAGLNSLIRSYRHGIQGNPFMRRPIFASARAPADAALMQQVAIQTAQLQLVNTQLIQARQLSEHLQETLEADRTRISREIHDQLGQLLTVLKFDVNFIKTRVNSDPINRQSVHDKAVEMMALIDDTIETVRHIAADLRPSLLDDLGLVAALEWHADSFQTRTGVACEVISNALQVQLDRNARTSLFRITQEALTNVTRHAQATRVYITLIEEDDGLTLAVQDNGKGIANPANPAPKSLGLLGIEERARLLGGTAQITSQAGKGTTITIRIPLNSRCLQANTLEDLGNSGLVNG